MWCHNTVQTWIESASRKFSGQFFCLQKEGSFIIFLWEEENALIEMGQWIPHSQHEMSITVFENHKNVSFSNISKKFIKFTNQLNYKNWQNSSNPQNSSITSETFFVIFIHCVILHCTKIEESLSKWMYLSNKKSCVSLIKLVKLLQASALLYLHLIMLSFASVFPKRFFGAVYTTRYGRIRSFFVPAHKFVVCSCKEQRLIQEKKKRVSQLALANIDYCWQMVPFLMVKLHDINRTHTEIKLACK